MSTLAGHIARRENGIGKSVPAREIARRAEGPLLLIDDHEPADDEALRADLAKLPAQTVVVVASREPFGAGRFAGGWEHAARELHLSRAAYFRRLRSASERVAAWLAMGSSSTA